MGIPRQSLGTSKADQKLYEQKTHEKAQSQQPSFYPWYPTKDLS
jgi:hypothetical protein